MSLPRSELYIPGYFCDEFLWTWKLDASCTELQASDWPIYPRERGRRHSFPPPYSYSVKNSPRWGPKLPHKRYTSQVSFSRVQLLFQDSLILPDGRTFEPPVCLVSESPEREEKEDHAYPEGYGWRKWPKVNRRMSGSFEGLLADTQRARNPAFIAPYRTPREPVLARPSCS